MVRTQISLTEAQMDALRRLSAERGASMAALVRAAVDSLVRGDDETEHRRRAKEVVGKFASGKNDVSEHHDRYLDDAYGR